MTCSRTHKVLELRLTGGGDVRFKVLDGSNGEDKSEGSEE